MLGNQTFLFEFVSSCLIDGHPSPAADMTRWPGENFSKRNIVLITNSQRYLPVIDWMPFVGFCHFGFTPHFSSPYIHSGSESSSGSSAAGFFFAFSR